MTAYPPEWYSDAEMKVAQREMRPEAEDSHPPEKAPQWRAHPDQHVEVRYPLPGQEKMPRSTWAWLPATVEMVPSGRTSRRR